MKYYIIAGEASGDLHASNLIKAIKRLDNAANFRCWGGDLMKAHGAELVKHYKDLAFMGFVEILMNIRTILKNINFCKKDILQYQPDALILVDYPGFNLRIASFAKQAGIKVFYYISPQVWAWKQGRVHQIKKIVDRMFVILPFEKEFYKKFNYDVDFVGHPLLDAVGEIKNHTHDEANEQLKDNPQKPVIAILPGSRKQEISKMLPIMLSITEKFPDYEFQVAAVTSLSENFYKEICTAHRVKIVYGKTYQLLMNAHAALVTSGTATLETALFGVPEVVCYKGSGISFFIAKRLVKIKYISLVNLIMDKIVVKELIQKDFNSNNLETELSKILNDQERNKMLLEFSELKNKLGGAGASAKTAGLIVGLM